MDSNKAFPHLSTEGEHVNVSQTRSMYEARLHTAHRRLYEAAQLADRLGDQEAVLEIHHLSATLHQLTERSLAGKRWRRTSQYSRGESARS